MANRYNKKKREKWFDSFDIGLMVYEFGGLIVRGIGWLFKLILRVFD